MGNLDDFFSLIGEEKKKKENKKKEIIGEVSLGDLFSTLNEEKKKLKERSLQKEKELEKIKKDAKIFETFLFSESPKVEQNASKAVKVLETELVNLKNTSYKSIDRLMRGICAEYDITPTKLHNKFKEKHNLIPDDWVKQQKEELDVSNWKDDYKPLEIETEDIITPEPLEPTEGIGSEIVSEEGNTIDKSLEILEQMIPEEEQFNESETEMARMKREVEQLRKMLYQTIQKVEVQGGGGEVRLEFLDDVDRSTAKTDGLYLKYDESLDKWVGALVGGGATTFTDLTDVDSSTKNGNSVVYNSGTGRFIGTDILGNFRQLISENVNDGDIVVYSASAGRFIATSQGNLIGTGRTTLVTLDDVVGTPSTNDVLIFNGTDFEFTTPFEIVDRSDGSDDDILDYGSF